MHGAHRDVPACRLQDCSSDGDESWYEIVGTHGLEHVLRLQIVQHAADRIVLRVLAAPRFSNADAERLMRNAQTKAPFRAHR